MDRLLAVEVPADFAVQPLKEALRGVVVSTTDDDAMESAVRADAFARTLLPRVAVGHVPARLSGGHDFLSTSELLQISELSRAWKPLPVRTVAALMHHLNGFNVGGQSLKVEVDLPEGTVLPPVSRGDRRRNRTRGVEPWLPFLDEVGRISATPRNVSRRHGQILNGWGRSVLDPFCGAGANAIGAALAGCTVYASDISPKRLELAKRNAAHFGVDDRIEFAVFDVCDALGSHEPSTVSLFLDPPWGGVGWDRDTVDFVSLFGEWSSVEQAINDVPAVMLKLPRTFNLCTLPRRMGDWYFELGIESQKDHPVDRIRLLTATSVKI